MNPAFQSVSSFPVSNGLHRRLVLLKVLALTILWVFTAGIVAAGEPDAIAVDDGSFKCLSDMERVRHFYVDNLQGDLAATIEVAKRGQGTYPPGSVVQLVPGEAMVKQPKGFNAATNDWEFFELNVSADGTSIRKRGFADVVNRFGGNCFACHVRARPEFDLICEDDHGCEPIPITRPMLAALQKTDARCSDPEPLTEGDKKALADLEQALKAMTAAAGPAQQ